MEKTVYIILSDTSTWFSKMIGMYTGRNRNHASIAFDEQLNEMYSFGRKQRYNPINGGFVQENARGGVFKNANCSIFQCKISLSEFEQMQNRVLAFREEQDRYKYNLLGLFGIALRLKINRENAYFCSQFVATIMNESSTLSIDTPTYLVQPHHIAEHPALHQIYEGHFQYYFLNNNLGDASKWKELAY
ncbi:hypothetical protein D0S48_16080 [Psychrobacillus sp. AK 1817]|uniref:hypothetical protein n=1 Tax=Psychrobacillus sp. AK 1817 TaxID=2303505 RepID=UPI0012493EF2|nr:hypothetical protein [Psychrobacillus sp. AK 1817]QEY22063.1 hypothetical protein D0S48_16080 [Psychrobacillus sp. AK 1817]